VKLLNKDNLEVIHKPTLPGDIYDFRADNSKICKDFKMTFQKFTP